MSDYTREAEEFLKEQGIPDKHIYTMHKLGGKIPVHLSWVLTRYGDYLKGIYAKAMEADAIVDRDALRNLDETINLTLGNAGGNQMTLNGSIHTTILDMDYNTISLEVCYCYQAEPSCDYDVEPFSDLTWWLADKSIDRDMIPADEVWKIEERLWDVINDTPNAI